MALGKRKANEKLATLAQKSIQKLSETDLNMMLNASILNSENKLSFTPQNLSVHYDAKKKAFTITSGNSTVNVDEKTIEFMQKAATKLAINPKTPGIQYGKLSQVINPKPQSAVDTFFKPAQKPNTPVVSIRPIPTTAPSAISPPTATQQASPRTKPQAEQFQKIPTSPPKNNQYDTVPPLTTPRAPIPKGQQHAKLPEPPLTFLRNAQQRQATPFVTKPVSNPEKPPTPPKRTRPGGNRANGE